MLRYAGRRYDKSKGARFVIFLVLSKAVSTWFLYLHSFWIRLSISIVLRRYPTTQLTIGTYPDLTIDRHIDGYYGFKDDTQLEDIICEFFKTVAVNLLRHVITRGFRRID